MRLFRDLSIRHKLTLLLLGVVSVVLVAVSTANVIHEVQTTRSAMAEKYTALAKIVAAESSAALRTADIDPSSAQKVLSDLAVERNIRFAALYNAEGKEVARFPADLPDVQRPAPPAELGAHFKESGFLDVVAEVNQAGDEIIGRIYLRATTDELRAQIRGTILIALVVFVIALAVAGLLSAALQRFIATPILQLAHVANRVTSQHDYSLRTERRGNDELGTLADGFNEMLAEIQRRDEELARHQAHLEDAVAQRTNDLRRSIERTRRIVDTAHDAFVAMDAAGHITDWNPQAEAIFGWTRDEALGQQVADLLVPEEYRAAHRRGLAHFLATGSGPVLNRRIELPALHKSGRTFPVELTITPLRTGEPDLAEPPSESDAPGESAPASGPRSAFTFAAFLHDITDRKQAEAELQRAKDAAEAADRAKSEFLANMSHEIRTPMNGVIGMADLLAGTPLRSDQREFLGLIQQSADSLLRLLNDILDFSKIEAGRMELESIEFPLADCVGKALQVLTLRAADKGLELACRIDPTVPDRLIGDPGRLRQIVVNLVGNAVKFTDQGEIVVNVQPADAAAQANGHIRLQVSVRDSGIGIPAEKLDRLFKAFSQADTSTTRKYGGTGLGLVISARLVEMMRGRIWVESQPGLGTTFHFVAEFGVAADQGQRVPAELSSLRGLGVLVVDDNATNRRILKELLTTWGLEPTLAVDGAAALREAEAAGRRGAPFRLVLLDYHMPGMDGLQLAERLKAQAGHAPCSMIMLSSSVGGLEPERLQSAGISRFMTKPVIGSELLEMILSELGVVAAKVVAADVEKRPQIAPRRVLLAEDSPINQKVALGFLTKWGHQVVVADNGRKAVEAFQSEPFDLILMDVQMPEMNGYDATAAIRRLEGNVVQRMPIIAMTAEALKGDRERCLEAGMDDYVAKPIDPDALYRVVASCLPRVLSAAAPGAEGAAQQPAGSTSPAAGKPSASSGVIDWQVASRITEGDRSLLGELIDSARQQTPRLVAELRQALAGSDVVWLRRCAHTLKATASYFGGQRLADAALRVELLARDGKVADDPAAVSLLEREAARFIAALESLPIEAP